MVKAKKLGHYTAFDYILVVFFVLFSLLMIYPIYYVIIGSLNQGLDYISGGVYVLPRKFTFDNYRVVFRLWRMQCLARSCRLKSSFI